jgi:DNA invertase Pin-like site-specific DNA recombinase
VTTTTETRRAIGYRRVSTTKQAGERHASLPEQENRITGYCAAEGLSLVGSFTDIQTGKRDDRAEYRRMVQFALDGDADVVVVRWLDRFGRNPREILRRVWQLQEAGVEVVATDEDLKEEIVLLVKAWNAGQESRRIAERVKGNMLSKARQGVKFGRAPYGFKRVVQPDGLIGYEQVPAEVATVREMARLVTKENLGYKAVADRLSAYGYPARSPRGWASEVIRKILNSPTLIGRMTYGAVPKKGNTSEVVAIDNYFEAILTQEDWNAVQARLAIRRETTPRGRTALSDYLLSGVARCGHCGAGLIGTLSSRRNRDGSLYRHRAYCCANAKRGKALCGFGKWHNASKLDEAVLEHLAQYSDPEKVRALVAAAPAPADALASDIQRVEQRLADLKADFLANLDLLKRGVLDEADFATANAARKGERESLEKRHAELAARIAAMKAQTDAADKLPQRIRDFREQMQEVPTQRAKALLQEILQAAYVWNDNRVELEFRFE